MNVTHDCDGVRKSWQTGKNTCSVKYSYFKMKTQVKPYRKQDKCTIVMENEEKKLIFNVTVRD